MANKKPARKGGARKPAPKQLTARQIDQFNADKMRADAAIAAGKAATDKVLAQLAASVASAGEFGASMSKPPHPTVEEQYSAEERRRMDAANGLARRVEREMAAHRHSLENPSLLRRAWNGVKRAFRFRSAKTGEYVTKQYAEANPDTTVRERAD